MSNEICPSVIWKYISEKKNEEKENFENSVNFFFFFT